jgi:hypothetical protein
VTGLAAARRTARALGHDLGRWQWNDTHVRAAARCRGCGALAHVEAGDAYGAALGGPCAHDCYAHAVATPTDGPLGVSWDCGRCGRFLQVG